jgi:hypothetical protein
MQTEQGRTRSYRSIRRSKIVSLSMMLLAVTTAASLWQVRATAQGLSQQVIWHSSTPITSISLNDNGWAVWSSGLGFNSQVYLYNGSTVTPLGTAGHDNKDARINNNDWVVWTAYTSDFSTTQIQAWKDGGTPSFISLNTDIGPSDEADSATINNLNQIAWHGQAGGDGIDDIFFLRPGDTQATDLTIWDTEGDSTGPRLSDTGLLSYERTTGNVPGGETNLILSVLDTSGATPQMTAAYQITNSSELNVLNGGINNDGRLVWYQYNEQAGKWDVWSFDPATGNAVDLSQSIFDEFGDPNQGDPTINNDGDIAWFNNYFDSSSKFHQDLYWYIGDGPQLVPIDSSNLRNAPVAINNTGDLLYATGNGSSTGYDLVLAQGLPLGEVPSPSPTVPEPGMLALTGALLLPGIGFLRSLRRKTA